jgi:hypothetical protein
MSALGHQRTLYLARAISGLLRNSGRQNWLGLRSAQQLQHLCDVRRNPPRLVPRQQLGRGASARLTIGNKLFDHLVGAREQRRRHL